MWWFLYQNVVVWITMWSYCDCYVLECRYVYLCACSTDKISNLFVWYGQYVSLCDGHICDGIVFDVWYVFTTLCMFLGVNLGWVPTLVVKIGWFLGWFTTFEILECIRWTDIVEPFFVFGIKTIVCATKTNITVWIRCSGSVAATQTTDQPKRYHNTVLL